MSTILITGASRGIGLELTRRLSANGHTVLATCRDPDHAEALRTLAAGGNIEILPLDVADAASVAALAETVGDRTVDVLINNAGIIGRKPQSTTEMDFDGLAETLSVNTIAPLRVAQALLPAIRRSSSGRIVTISSKMGSFSSLPTDRIAYRASKAAVNRIMVALAEDLRPDNIAVLVMHPGWVRTDMGGSAADIAVEDSAAGIARVVTGLGMGQSGQFLNYDGSQIPW